MMAFLIRWTTSDRMRAVWPSSTFRTVLTETPAIRATSEILVSGTDGTLSHFGRRGTRASRTRSRLDLPRHERGHLDAGVGEQAELEHRHVEPPGQLPLRARRILGVADEVARDEGRRIGDADRELGARPRGRIAARAAVGAERRARAGGELVVERH